VPFLLILFLPYTEIECKGEKKGNFFDPPADFLWPSSFPFPVEKKVRGGPSPTRFSRVSASRTQKKKKNHRLGADPQRPKKKGGKERGVAGEPRSW